MKEPKRGSPEAERVDANPDEVARSIVLRRLSATPRTRKELSDDLRKRGTADDVIDRVLNRFIEVGLIDDAEYARMWVSSRQRTKGSARSVLRQELRSKGVDDDDVTEALGAIGDDEERARALLLVRSKLNGTRRLEPKARIRRLVGVLQRRGYRQGVAFDVVKEALGAEAEELDLISDGEDGLG